MTSSASPKFEKSNGEDVSEEKSSLVAGVKKELFRHYNTGF
jgi:hypothetical protein